MGDWRAKGRRKRGVEAEGKDKEKREKKMKKGKLFFCLLQPLLSCAKIKLVGKKKVKIDLHVVVILL